VLAPRSSKLGYKHLALSLLGCILLKQGQQLVPGADDVVCRYGGQWYVLSFHSFDIREKPDMSYMFPSYS
jgi:hypothetical protein